MSVSRVPLAAALAFAFSWAPAVSYADEPAKPEAIPEVVVIGVAPVPGAGVDEEKVPRNVRRVTAHEMALTHPLGLNDVLNTRVGGVVASDTQENPLQPDVSFRGFSVSPLLGVPQGLAVYQNGVRANEPFGDTVQWDMVPDFAIDEIDVLPGANAVYGLNALGGAILLKMKNGFTYDGAHIVGEGGSFARLSGLLESGRHFGPWAVYGAGSLAGESGWRDHSPWIARRLYADVRRRTDSTEFSLSVTAANNELRGNGPAPVELLQQRRASIFTYPDITSNRSLLVQLEANTKLTEVLSMQGVVYTRRTARDTLNADDAGFVPCAADASLLCDEDGGALHSISGGPIPSTAGGNGAINTTRTRATSFGASVQLAASPRIAERDNVLVAGASVDAAPVAFSRHAEVGQLTADRGVQGSGIRAGGEEFHTDIEADQTYLGLYATDTFSPTDSLSFNVAGRLNGVFEKITDNLGTSLNGSYQFVRFNPSLGVTYRIVKGLNAFAGYGESNRAPTPAELACADPTAPCRVPNAFLSDPPLQQVVSRSIELGVRGKQRLVPKGSIEYSLAAFGSRNANDILFIAGSRVGTGYFQNSGTTQRVGGEASVGGTVGKVRAFANYQLLRATFEDRLTLPGLNNPNAVQGPLGEPVITVEPGDSIPGMPVHTAKVGATVEAAKGLTLGLTSIMSSSIWYRGDEANLMSPVPGYVLLGADVSYRLFRFLTVYAKARNVLNTRYETFGVLGDPTTVFPNMSDPRFLSPGAPFGIWGGVDVSLE
jgi:outer membrane receptor protein involved in Fe transport